MCNIIQKIRFSCLASCLLCVPLYGAHLVDVGDEKEVEGYNGTNVHGALAQSEVVDLAQNDIVDYTEQLGKQVDHMLDEDDIEEMHVNLKIRHRRWFECMLQYGQA